MAFVFSWVLLPIVAMPWAIFSERTSRRQRKCGQLSRLERSTVTADNLAWLAQPAFATAAASTNCDTQQEIDEFWAKLSDGGKTDRCGWLQDKYGLSWQMVPAKLGALLEQKDPPKSNRVMQALMQMTKIDVGRLQQAAEPG
jgi:predicted 3-demethylubiquinone-9 3-methyltransferase (glyoxalase superfamily)